jgi:hypothetical protein
LDSLVSSPIRDIENPDNVVYRLPGQEFVGFWGVVEKSGQSFELFGAIIEL